MKQQWDKFNADLGEFQGIVEELLNGLKPGTKNDKIRKAFASSWQKVCFSLKEVDKYFSPIDPIEAKYPFASDAFKEAWKFYLEYLEEEHHDSPRSRRQKKMLDALAGWSEGKEENAIGILDFLSRSGYKSFFKPTIKQASGEEPAKLAESISVFVPANEMAL